MSETGIDIEDGFDYTTGRKTYLIGRSARKRNG